MRSIAQHQRIAGALCFITLSLVSLTSFALVLPSRTREVVKQSYNEGKKDAFTGGKRAKVQNLLGLARSRYLKELRTRGCIRHQRCPVAFIDNLNGLKIVKIVIPRFDGTEVNLFGPDGWDRIGSCSVRAGESCYFN